VADIRNILIADGKPGSIPNLRTPLRELGYDVVAVGDATFVLTMAMRQKPAAVILGAQLPAGGSLTALRRLRASVHTASIPVIALAAPGAQKQALLSAGAEQILEPPVSESDVLDAIRSQLGISRAVAEAPAEVLRDPVRLSALNSTGLLDSEPDEALDVVTRLAARVLGVPVALVSLVDDKRQFFKSQIGLPAPWDARRQTPLSHSFCQWVVSSEEELVVDDAREHPVLRSNLAVSEIGVVAYAGMPLSAVTGEPIGSFCAIDGKPRHWTEDERAALRCFAQLIDAQAALSLPPAVPDARERHAADVTRAAARGFQGAARLLRRTQPPLKGDEIRDLTAIIERHSNQLMDLAAAPVQPAAPLSKIAVFTHA